MSEAKVGYNFQNFITLQQQINKSNVFLCKRITIKMKKRPIVSILTILFLLAVNVLSAQQEPVHITILHTNDMHSRMLGFSPNSDYTPFRLNDDLTYGGMARMASMVDSVRAHEENVLLVDAGDFMMGTVFQTLEPTTGFQLRLMKKIGWDVVSIGNHEFDFGIDGLTDIITSAKKNGEIPPLVLSNIVFCDTLADDDRFENLFTDKTITTYYVIEKGGVRIGFFGLLGKDAYEVAPYAKPMTTRDQAQVAKEMTAFLREKENADIVVALSHSGVFKNEAGEYEREDVDVAVAVPDLDLIISGHTHTVLPEPLVVNGVPIVQTGAYCYNIGKVELEIQNGEVNLVGYELMPIDDTWQGNAEVQGIIDDQMVLINDHIFGDMGLRGDSVLVETSFALRINEEDLLANSNLGPFIADGIYSYFQKLDNKGVDITLVAAGLIRENILPGALGMQCATDLYRVLPLGRGIIDEDSPGYSLAKIYITGHELKNVLEIMQIAPSLSTSNFPYWSGIRYAINPIRMPLDKIYKIEIGNDTDGYREIDLSKDNETLYSLGANNYLLEFVSLIKDLSKGILNVEPKNRDGEIITDIKEVLIDRDPTIPGVQEAKEWAALMAFCAGFEDLNGNGIPDIPSHYDLNQALVLEDSGESNALTGTMIKDGDSRIINKLSSVSNSNARPGEIFSASNGVTWIGYGVVLFILIMLFLLIRFIMRRIKRRNR